jgi:hypothetical protein
LFHAADLCADIICKGAEENTTARQLTVALMARAGALLNTGTLLEVETAVFDALADRAVELLASLEMDRP